MILCGCDVGASSVKVVVMEEETQRILFAHTERIRKRNPAEAVEAVFAKAQRHGFHRQDFSYTASTGEAEAVHDRTGHFYSMTCHARGARFFFPETMTVLDLGALHMRAMKLDGKGRVTTYKMTSQCASGTGQFLENIVRYLGLSSEELGELSMRSQNPQVPSTICAVLAETDIVNMVSRGVPLSDILRGIHDSIARRAVKLVSSLIPEPILVLTGGMAMDRGLVRSLEMELHSQGFCTAAQRHEMAIYAGAIGAALWGGVRRRRLAVEESVASGSLDNR